MEARQSINRVANGEVIHHTGDLTIEGDVGENAEINLKSGQLIILGNIQDGVKIKLTADVAAFIEKPHDLYPNIVTNVTSCNISQNVNGLHTMTGNVNINNRILTDDMVTDLGKNKYKITIPNNNMFGFNVLLGGKKVEPSSSGMATATIDGLKYEGKEIIVDGNNVFVDGKKQVGSAKEAEKPSKLMIHGNVGNVVTIECDAPIEVLGSIGNFCNITSKSADFVAKSLGEETAVTVHGKISITNAGKYCKLISSHAGFAATSLDNNVTVDACEAIHIMENIGHGCVLRSKQSGVRANQVGDSAIIRARDKIVVHDVGSNSELESETDTFDAANVGDVVSITARNAISLSSIGSECKITGKSAINILSEVGSRTTITAKDSVSTGTIGNHSKIVTKGKVKIRGNAGSHVTIQAGDRVTLKDVGDETEISSNDEVNAKNLGSRVVINAQADIDIDGVCPEDARLNSSRGIITVAAAQPVVLPNAVILQKQGVFPVPQNAPIPDPVDEIPEYYLCVIRQEIMVKPVVCSLDGRTYEDAAIRAWFAKHNSSPSNRAEIPKGKTIDDVLTINRNLEEAIVDFRSKRPELFRKSSKKL